MITKRFPCATAGNKNVYILHKHPYYYNFRSTISRIISNVRKIFQCMCIQNRTRRTHKFKRIFGKPDSGSLESFPSFLLHPSLDIAILSKKSFSCLNRVKNYLRSSLMTKGFCAFGRFLNRK